MSARKCAVIAGATGFIGKHFLQRCMQREEYHNYLLVGHNRHIEKLRELKCLNESASVRISNYSELPKLVESNYRSYQFCIFDFSNSLNRKLDSSGFGRYLSQRLTDARLLIEPFLGENPYVLVPLSWHSFRLRRTYYSVTKHVLEEFFRALEDMGLISLCRVVLFDTYGPEDTRDKIVPQILSIPPGAQADFIANPRAMINLTHIDDVIDGLLALSRPCESGIFQIKNEIDTTVGEVVELLSRTIPPVNALSSSGEELLLPRISVRTPRSWVPKILLEDGLADVSSSSLH